MPLSATETAQPEASLLAEVERLRPWRYGHKVGGIAIASDFPAADAAFNGAGRAKDIVAYLAKTLIGGRDAAQMRVLDLGCLEGHYTAIFCALGFGEVVGIDLSESHLARAAFLLHRLHGFGNARLVHGNVSNPEIVAALGRFDIILCHGLLYHLKAPLALFDSFEALLATDRPAHVLLSTQFKGSFLSIVDERPLLEMQVKGRVDADEGPVVDVARGSSFDRFALRMNPKAIDLTLKAHGYRSVIAYDTPTGGRLGFALNLVLAKQSGPADRGLLDNNHGIAGLRFAPWNGADLSNFPVAGSAPIRLLRWGFRRANQVIDLLTVRRRLRRRAPRIDLPPESGGEGR